MEYQKFLDNLTLSYREEQSEYFDTLTSYFNKDENQNKPLFISAETGIGKTLSYIVPALEYISNTDKKLLIVTDTKHNRENIVKNVNYCASKLFPSIEAIALQSRFDSLDKDKFKTFLNGLVIQPDEYFQSTYDMAVEFVNDYNSNVIPLSDLDQYGININLLELKNSDIFISSIDLTNNNQNYKVHVITQSMLLNNWAFRNTYLNSQKDSLYGALIIDEVHNLLSIVNNEHAMDINLVEIKKLLASNFKNDSEVDDLKKDIKKVIDVYSKILPLNQSTEFDPNIFKSRIFNGIVLDDVNILFKNISKKLRKFLNKEFDSTYHEYYPNKYKLLDLLKSMDMLYNCYTKFKSDFEGIRFFNKIVDKPKNVIFSIDTSIPGLRAFAWLWNLDIKVIATTASFGIKNSKGDFFETYKKYFNLNGIFTKDKIDDLSSENPLKKYGISKFNLFENFKYNHPLEENTYLYNDEHMKLLKNTINKIPSTENIVILVTSFKKGAQIYNQLLNSNYVIFRQMPGVTDAIENFRNSNVPAILITTRWVGLDLPGKVHNLVIPSIPFSPPGDNSSFYRTLNPFQIHMHKEGIKQELILKLYQGIGRGIRSDTDKCNYWLLDPRMPRIYGGKSNKFNYIRNSYPVRFKERDQIINKMSDYEQSMES